MRILHVVTLVDDRSSYGGPLTVAVNQCIELRRRGHDARIMAGWTGKGAPPKQLEGVPVHLFRVRSVVPGMRFSGLISVRMLAWLKQNAKTFDVGHLHTARDLVPLSAGEFLRLAGVRYMTQTHGMVLPDARRSARLIDRLLTLRVLRNAKSRFVLTDHETTALSTLLGPKAPTVRLPNGVAIHENSAIETAARTSDGPIDVLFMARLHPRKNVMDFATAAHALIEEGLIEKGHDLRFSVVGPDEGDLTALMAFIGLNPGLKGRLHYEGPINHEDAVGRLARAGVFVLPSVNEPFPMTLLESLAVGTPTVCTTSCGVADDLQADDAALVIEPGAASLTSALRSLIESPALRQSLSAAGQRTARANYSMQTVGDRLITAYTEGQHTGLDTPTKLLWITNIATPYTVPVWRELGKLVDLHIACLAETETNRQWQTSLDGVSASVLHARSVKVGQERTLYLPTLRLIPLLRRRPDVVVLDGWESPVFWQARLLAKLFGVHVVMSYWSTAQTHRFSTGPIAAFRSWFFRSAHGVITPGPAATDAVRAMGVPEHSITTGFGTVDVARFSAGARAARARLAERPGHHFLYVGQLIGRKNIQSLLRAFHSVRAGDDTLTIIGTGPLDEQLQKLSVDLGLTESVSFRGHQDMDDLIRSYAAADTLVLPSTEEVWGLVVNEGLACGLSVVVSDRCGVSRSVETMPSVYVTEPESTPLAVALYQARQDTRRPDESHPITELTPSALAAKLSITFTRHQKAMAS